MVSKDTKSLLFLNRSRWAPASSAKPATAQIEFEKLVQLTKYRKPCVGDEFREPPNEAFALPYRGLSNSAVKQKEPRKDKMEVTPLEILRNGAGYSLKGVGQRLLTMPKALKTAFRCACLVGLVSPISYAQTIPVVLPVDSETKKITYSNVVLEDSANQALLHTRASIWLDHCFATKAPIRYAKSSDSFSSKGWQIIHVGVGNDSIGIKLWFNVVLQIKEGQYTYTLSNFAVQPFSDKHGAEPLTPAESFIVRQNNKRKEAYAQQIRLQLDKTRKQYITNLMHDMRKGTGTTHIN
ncbi:hypothetical protein [Hymenobacter persicinus]|uniref:DUF4468 domain-containing protein n=1 Tax=Hymenobacter persicinus TaxID=2025506 RepID=A0A4Q5L7U1_9BACT|nr:hypothetical protein [Hymenobacter persicinus]RYU77677.1 hypothetical protein EWM57_17280 [Hymenobacter persicinus]